MVLSLIQVITLVFSLVICNKLLCCPGYNAQHYLRLNNPSLSLIVRSDFLRFLQMSPFLRLSASNSDSNSLMRVSILIMAFLPPFKALTSASSALAPASLHCASRSF